MKEDKNEVEEQTIIISCKIHLNYSL